MPRNMSFMLTTEQVKNRNKTVTRRLGSDNLKVGEVLNACEKCQGLRKGEKIVKLATIRIVSRTKEPLTDIWPEDVAREGFPHWTPERFIAFFCAHNRCSENELVNRIEFEYIG